MTPSPHETQGQEIWGPDVRGASTVFVPVAKVYNSDWVAPGVSSEYVVQTTRPLLADGSGRMETEGCCPSGPRA
ncbi:MAG: hypothetical protein H0V70_10285 [Ktedonobacteraceae bacterium]|nr:hypothetical protein [Ktedonobacteraceae bacterium]